MLKLFVHALFCIFLLPLYAFQYELSICAIFHDEAPYLKEWIEFHRLMGVEHFYLISHQSQDDYLLVLKPYLDAGIVNLLELTENDYLNQQKYPTFNDLQTGVYTGVARKVAGVSKWVAFIDTDEFLFPVEKNNLIDFLKDYEQFDAVCANWQLFGTSHVPSIPSDKLMIELLISCAEPNYRSNIHVKAIVKPEKVDWFPNPHSPVYVPGAVQVTADKQPFSGPFSPSIAVDKFRINHYWTRDEFFFWTQKVPRRTKWNTPYYMIQEMYEALNVTYDTTILKFVPQLRERMQFY